MSLEKPRADAWWMRYLIDSLNYYEYEDEEHEDYVFDINLDYNNGSRDFIEFLKEEESETEDEDYYYSMLFI